MMLASATPKVVGSVVYEGFNARSEDGSIFGQPSYIVREVTRAEWLEWATADLGRAPNEPFGPFPYYYEVSTD